MTLTKERLEGILKCWDDADHLTIGEVKEMASRLLELEQKLAEAEKENKRWRVAARVLRVHVPVQDYLYENGCEILAELEALCEKGEE